jgi:hypothetical protein
MLNVSRKIPRIGMTGQAKKDKNKIEKVILCPKFMVEKRRIRIYVSVGDGQSHSPVFR